MTEDRDSRIRRSPAERIIEKDRRDVPGVGEPLSRTAVQYRRTLEGYQQAGNRPRWMERLAEIDRGEAQHARKLEAAYAALREELAGDPEGFARRWRETARRWSFDAHNVVVGQHNEWYPIERQLPVNPRTGEYVAIHGRSYRRRELDAGWVLERFPPEL